MPGKNDGLFRSRRLVLCTNHSHCLGGNIACLFPSSGREGLNSVLDCKSATSYQVVEEIRSCPEVDGANNTPRMAFESLCGDLSWGIQDGSLLSYWPRGTGGLSCQPDSAGSTLHDADGWQSIVCWL